MGNSSYQGVISNATPWPVQITIKESFLQTDTKVTSINWGVGAQIKHSSPSIHAGFGHQIEENSKRKEIQTKFDVNPDCSQSSILKLPIEEAKDYFFSLAVIHPEGEKVLVENMHVTEQKMIKNCIWVKNGQPVLTQVADRWRFVSGNEHGVNYPPGKSCEECGRSDKCERGCGVHMKHRGFRL